MPGILPMKVIKVGMNAQTRIAQACDRCRSKKIRCDGVRPCCSPCANVGFECKTSDKLSRRAFPRGYTESLEERVRGLEWEVRELKELLDEKDEKIDMLSRIRSQSTLPSLPIPPPSLFPRSPSKEDDDDDDDNDEDDDRIQVQQSQSILVLQQEGGDAAEPCFAGSSSARTFIDAWRHRVHDTGRSMPSISPSTLVGTHATKTAPSDNDASSFSPASPMIFKAPPRLLSDQLINVFFQEWSPLFPVLHRPTFLALYERYMANAASVVERAELAQLNLVLGIAALSKGDRSSADLRSFESQWKAALDPIITHSSISILQALILAQLFCIQQGDFTRLLPYKALSTTICTRLGLNQSQKPFALGTLTCETRKKVFWSFYTIDSFTAVLLGLPKHLKDEDVHCELPIDADDECITEHGFRPPLPGESTKISSALALFSASRILSKVLQILFSAKLSYDLSLKKISELSDELDCWSAQLPPHLSLHFAQDKPSTGTTSSRSPLLSLTYHYIRSLIHRPAICASLGARSPSSMIAMASSCKHITQIVQLLDERGLSFSFCLNRDELLVLSGVALLFQGLDLEMTSKILKDNGKMLTAIVHALNMGGAPCAVEFERVVNSFVPPSIQESSSKRESPPPSFSSPSSRQSSERVGPSRSSVSPASTRKQLTARTSNTPKLDAANGARRATLHHLTPHPHSQQMQIQPSLQPSPSYDGGSISHSEPVRSPVHTYSRPQAEVPLSNAPNPPQLNSRPALNGSQQLTNLDYLAFGNEPDSTPAATRLAQPIKTEPGPTDWERLLGSLDNGETNIYGACYGVPPVNALLDVGSLGIISSNTSSTKVVVSSASAPWNSDLWALCHNEPSTSSPSHGQVSSAGLTTASILSFSTDEGLSSSEDFCTDWNAESSRSATFRGILIPQDGMRF